MFIERDACRTHRKGECDIVDIEHLLTVERYRNNMQGTPQGPTGAKLLTIDQHADRVGTHIYELRDIGCQLLSIEKVASTSP